jgi:SAM-dependent methyltransferase
MLREIIQRGTRPIRMWIAESPSTRDVHLIWYQLRTRGIKRTVTRNFYDEGFFQEHIKLKPAYQKLADIIFNRFRPRSVCDFGCGNGYLLQFLAEKGVDVSGIEGSEASLDFMDSRLRERVRIKDLTEIIDTDVHDLVISTEVAEHLPRKASTVLVHNLTNSASRAIVFSAARPGQWGDGHINCQPKEFWIKLFELSGWSYDQTATNEFTSAIKESAEIFETLPWLVDNFMLFAPMGRAGESISQGRELQR